MTYRPVRRDPYLLIACGKVKTGMHYVRRFHQAQNLGDSSTCFAYVWRFGTDEECCVVIGSTCYSVQSQTSVADQWSWRSCHILKRLIIWWSTFYSTVRYSKRYVPAKSGRIHWWQIRGTWRPFVIPPQCNCCVEPRKMESVLYGQLSANAAYLETGKGYDDRVMMPVSAPYEYLFLG